MTSAVTTSVTKYVYDFNEGNRDMKDLLGGKGANLAEMTNMGLPVPPGFTITTEACLTFLAQGGPPPGMLQEAGEHLARLQETMGKQLGDPDDPLLVSVRSGAKFSMPGMMDTVLNLGLNDVSVKGLAAQTGGDMRFANDAYRRFIQMFGKIVMDVPADAFEHALEEAKERKGAERPGHGSGRRGPGGADRSVPRHLPRAHGRGLPAGPEGSAPAVHRRGIRVMERQARHRLPPSEQDQRRPGHRREHRRDGLRQPRRGLGHRGGVHARPLDGREGALRRLPVERAGGGRRRGHPQHVAACAARAARPHVVQGTAPRHGHPRGPLPRHVRHRVHHREGQALDPADAHRQAHGLRRMGHGVRHVGGRAHRRRHRAAPCGREPSGGAVQAPRRRVRRHAHRHRSQRVAGRRHRQGRVQRR